MMICTNVNRLLMQFHITGKCNLQCKHCYRTEGNIEPLSFSDVIDIIEQYKTLRIRYNKHHCIKKRGHINITGGEPFIRNDICDIIDYMGKNKDYFSFGILTNGSFINEATVSCLNRNNVSFVQLSIDGNRTVHDELRAKGDYDRTFRVASFLEKNGIRTYISFTANAKNYKHLPSVARACRRYNITKLWSDRLVPIGNGSEILDLAITKDILPDYLKYLKKAQGGKITKLLYPKTAVSMNRALQFLESTGNIYSCSAGDSLITVDEFGRIMPCRRMPVICGNVSDNTLEDVYFNSEVFNDLRQKTIPIKCRECVYSVFCRGGAKCQTFAVCSDYNLPDPSCPLI